ALPDTTITIRSGDTKIRWREPELARLPRASQALSPSPACALPLLQGVHLTDQLPARAGLAVIDAYVIQLGVLRTRRFAASQLAPGSDLMVADTRQRGFTDRLSPFAFSFRFRTATWRSSTTSAALRSKNTDSSIDGTLSSTIDMSHEYARNRPSSSDRSIMPLATASRLAWQKSC